MKKCFTSLSPVPTVGGVSMSSFPCERRSHFSVHPFVLDLSGHDVESYTSEPHRRDRRKCSTKLNEQFVTKSNNGSASKWPFSSLRGQRFVRQTLLINPYLFISREAFQTFLTNIGYRNIRRDKSVNFPTKLPRFYY